MLVAELFFWGCFGMLAFTYFGYPLSIWLIGKISHRYDYVEDRVPAKKVLLVIAARNEADVLKDTIENKLEQDYPAELLKIIVVSDASDDGTDEIVQAYDGRVKLIRLEKRSGKTVALNTALEEADADIVVFSDANSIFGSAAVTNLVRRFTDPRVGYVTGKMIYRHAGKSLNSDGCSNYMRYENMIRELETNCGSVIGVDGGIDAIRYSLFKPMRADQLPDFVLPLSVLDQGFFVVYAPQALLTEDALSDSADEFSMRVRVVTRALWALRDMRGLLNPLRYPLISYQIFVHKVMRYLAVVPITTLLVSNIALADLSATYTSLLLAQLAFYAVAALGFFQASSGRMKYTALPYYFVLVNLACAVGCWHFLRGKKVVIWQPRIG